MPKNNSGGIEVVRDGRIEMDGGATAAETRSKEIQGEARETMRVVVVLQSILIERDLKVLLWQYSIQRFYLESFFSNNLKKKS
ncbi:hypothetical protein TSUD_149640 [Trifolium subterraneum]|uniref:Uncharacterized protein n=1 Tax=Trifolium subterraneum TaxID=3900 RepID=A0A2Z6N4Y1_TRISU|nr:hypothetical protein TSUD_149640 [Trifolium subterraneum]